MWLFLLTPLILIVLTIALRKLNQDYFLLTLCKRIKTVDGSALETKLIDIPGTTRFGNNFDLLHMTPEKLFRFCRENCAFAAGKSYLLKFLFANIYSITTAEDAEEIFQSTTLITKSIIYDLLVPFLGDGLLISTDKKWHARRKMLTPAFHFNVLQSFNEIFKEECAKLLNKLETLSSSEIDVTDIITEFSLNNICETAMGVKLDNITGGSEYRKIIHDIETTIVHRLSNPLMYYRIIFYFLGQYRKQIDSIKIAHDFSSKIIEKKRQEFLERQKAKGSPQEKENEFGEKKRYAMLDTLLMEESKGVIDHKGICEEVDTFTFEGYDTTSTALIFTIFNLSLHPEVQQKCRKEIEDLADFESLTVFDFNQLEYLECVLKESLRMYPSVPFVARMCRFETRVNGLILPTNTQINVHIYDIMRDPRHFPEPNVYKPERFLADASQRRHPFAFVPFSAGSRNCIGQKFAILEMKSILVALLKNYEILPVTKSEDLVFLNGLILRTQQKIYVKLKKISQ